MQIQFAKRQDVVPITPDYIAREETRLRRSNTTSNRRCGLRANKSRAVNLLRRRRSSTARCPQWIHRMDCG